MRVNMSEILNAMNIVRSLANTPMKAKAAYKVARLVNAIDKEYSMFQEVRNELINKYGVRDENDNLKIDENNNYSIKKELINQFNTEFNELLAEEIDLNVNPLNMNDVDEKTFTPNEMIALAPFLEEE